MTTHTSPSAGQSQCAKILDTLKANVGIWVSRQLLADRSRACAVNSRISELRRRDGYNIDQKNRYVGRSCRSFYRLNDPAAEQFITRPLDLVPARDG